MAGDGQAGTQVGPCRGLHELAIDVGQPAAIDTYLDETGPDAGVVDAIGPFGEPALGELVG